MKKLLYPLLFTFLITIFSCQGTNEFNPSAYIIQEDSLIAILKEIHIVDAAAKQNFIPNNADNYNKYREYKFVLEKYKISKARFDSTISFYASYAEEFEEIYTKLITEMKEDEKEFDK